MTDDRLKALGTMLADLKQLQKAERQRQVAAAMQFRQTEEYYLLIRQFQAVAKRKFDKLVSLGDTTIEAEKKINKFMNGNGYELNVESMTQALNNLKRAF